MPRIWTTSLLNRVKVVVQCLGPLAPGRAQMDPNSCFINTTQALSKRLHWILKSLPFLRCVKTLRRCVRFSQHVSAATQVVLRFEGREHCNKHHFACVNLGVSDPRLFVSATC